VKPARVASELRELLSEWYKDSQNQQRISKTSSFKKLKLHGRMMTNLGVLRAELIVRREDCYSGAE